MTDHLESATRLYLVQEIERLRGDLGVAAITESMLRATISGYKEALEAIADAKHFHGTAVEKAIQRIAHEALETK